MTVSLLQSSLLERAIRSCSPAPSSGSVLPGAVKDSVACHQVQQVIALLFPHIVPLRKPLLPKLERLFAI